MVRWITILFTITFIQTAYSSENGIRAKIGDTVKVHYTLVVDKRLMDSSSEREPLEFKIGNKEVIPGFEMGVIGMKVGEKKTVRVPPMAGYGPYRKELIEVFPRNQLPDAKIGKVYGMKHYKTGELRKGRVIKVTKKEVYVDLNHPLAGKILYFTIELVTIVK